MLTLQEARAMALTHVKSGLAVLCPRTRIGGIALDVSDNQHIM